MDIAPFIKRVARLLNPLQCAGQLNGFFHTTYADYMAEANRLPEPMRSLVFMGARMGVAFEWALTARFPATWKMEE